jgi:hypothetical protein
MLKNWVSCTSAATVKCSFNVGVGITKLRGYETDKWHQFDLGVKEIVCLRGKKAVQ